MLQRIDSFDQQCAGLVAEHRIQQFAGFDDDLVSRDAFMARTIIARRALSLSTPRAKGAPLSGLRGLTAKRGQATDSHAKNGKEHVDFPHPDGPISA